MQELDYGYVNRARMESPPPPGAPPTTFVRTDAATFKELVQRLTAGPLDDGGHRHRHHRPPSPSSSSSRPSPDAAAIPGHRLSGAVSKRVHESRRGGGGGGRRRFTALRPRAISLPASPSALSPAASPGRASPSTGLAGLHICAAEDDGSAAELNEEEEERAIKEKRFYLHPSPRPRQASAAEPELLPLFPASSPHSNRP